MTGLSIKAGCIRFTLQNICCGRNLILILCLRVLGLVLLVFKITVPEELDVIFKLLLGADVILVDLLDCGLKLL
jgi:hypothetical protein